MLETFSDAISSGSGGIDWNYSRDDIVDGVEAVFSAIKDRQDSEQEFLEDLWEIVEKLAALAGEAFEWPIQLGVAAAAAPFLVIGAGYLDAAEEIKRKRASISFCEGVALGVMAETKENVRDYFWQANPLPNPAFPEAAKLAQYYTNGGLALGYLNGRQVFAEGQAPQFWEDIKPNLTQSFGDPNTDNWGRRQWIDYHIAVATAFYRGHVEE
jgi:hypothetical protein